MRRVARTDANQRAVVDALRKAGASVAVTSHVGEGFPDLVVGYRSRNWLIELKRDDMPPSRRKLTPDEEHFHKTWRGEIYIVNSPEEAISLVFGVGP